MSSDSGSQIDCDDLKHRLLNLGIINKDAIPTKMKHVTPQKAVDEFWERFTTKQPGKGMLLFP